MALLRAADPLALALGLALAFLVLAVRADAATLLREADLIIDSEFPGGNLLIDRVQGDRVFLCQDVRDTRGTWFWWHFRVRGAAGRTLTFAFTKGNVIGVRGPAVSTDGGRTWAWLGKEAVKGASFTDTFAPDADKVRFCFAMPYFEADLRRFLGRFEGDPHLKADTLCTTRKGRKTERLHAGQLNGEPDHRVLVTCRHHCCECMASYALEGLVETILTGEDAGKWLREHVELLAIPFMDKDGVEDGDQGKNRKPHDHNRDYGDKPIYPAVRAIKRLVPEWSGGKLRLALDLHCPWIRGGHNEVIYLVGSPDARIWHEQQRFGQTLERVLAGPLKYRAADNLPFGKSWNTARNFADGLSFSRWAAGLPGIVLATTIEIPYANASGCEVNPASARAFGHDLAKAIRAYLGQLP